MPQVKIPQLKKEILISKGENLFKALRDNQIPIASSCGGEAVCGKCTVIITSKYTPEKINDVELELIKKDNLPKNVRVSCQMSVHSDIEIKTNYW